MNWEKRLEDARARRQVVLEQKDRAARAAKAAAQRTPEPAKAPTNSGNVQSISRARPAGSNARAVEAALRKRDIIRQPDQSPTETFEFRANESVEPEIQDNRENVEESVPSAAEQSAVANAVPTPSRRARPELRVLLIAMAVLVGFGFGIFAGPTIVGRVQRLASLPQVPFALKVAPQKPAAAEVAERQPPFSAIATSDETLTSSIRNAPLPPELVAFRPALPAVSLPAFGAIENAATTVTAPQVSASNANETVSSGLIVQTRPAPRRPQPTAIEAQNAAPLSLAAVNGPSALQPTRRAVDEESNIQIAALPLRQEDGGVPETSALTAVAVDAAPIALLSPGPQLVSTPGSQDLALLRKPEESPSLPFRSIAPDRPESGPALLAPPIGDKDLSAIITDPPETVETSRRLTGIGNLRSYLVHLQAPTSLSDRQLTGFETVISDAGLPVGKVNRVGYKISASHVRYYHRRDAVAAAALAERIGARSRDFTSYRPSPPIGTLEVFLSKSAKSNRAATQGATQLSQQDRELIELRDRLIQSLRRGDHL